MLLLTLAATLGLVVVLLASLLGNDDGGEIRTSTVYEMVASLDDSFQRVAIEMPPRVPGRQSGSWWSGLLMLVPLALWGLYRARFAVQQHSRSKRS